MSDEPTPRQRKEFFVFKSFENSFSGTIKLTWFFKFTEESTSW